VTRCRKRIASLLFSVTRCLPTVGQLSQAVEITKELTYDMYDTVERIHNSWDQTAVAADAAETVGADNKFALFEAVLDHQ